MSEISRQVEDGLSVDAGFRVDGPDLLDHDPDRPEPTDDDVRLTPVFGVESWELPGFGESGDKCGNPVPVGVCEAGHAQWGEHRCGRRSCSECYGRWAREASARAATRVQSFRETQPDDWHSQAAHITFSPQNGDINTEREYFDGYSKAAEVAQEKGMRGFAVIGHPWRVTDRGKALYAKHGAEDSEYGLWVWLRKTFEFDELMELIKWEPHYHIIGMTTEDMEPGSEDDDFVYEFHGSLERYGGVEDRDSHEDVFGKFRYLLSHTGYPSGSTKQVIRWYGCLSNSTFVDDATEDWQIQKPLDAEERIREILEELSTSEIEEGDGDTEDEELCDCEGCDAPVVPLEDLSLYLREYDPPDDVRDVMEAVIAWRFYGGIEMLPPGAKNPQNQEEAEEALQLLIEGGI